MTETKNSEIGWICRHLRDIGNSLSGTVDTGDLAQEILDFLAMAAGLKPVFLLGRGLESPQWVADVTGLAADAGFQVVKGPFWDATPFGKFPDWYKEHTVAQLEPFRATYVCSSRETARELGSINDSGGRLSMSAEARLLGYPVCCVVAHYDRAVRYHQAIFAILRRLAGGDEAQMRELLRGAAALVPNTQGEIAHMEAAFDLRPAPYGSWNQCPHCARNDDSPSAKLSEQYKDLAETTDPELVQNLVDYSP
jgi:hypothetical protein